MLKILRGAYKISEHAISSKCNLDILYLEIISCYIPYLKNFPIHFIFQNTVGEMYFYNLKELLKCFPMLLWIFPSDRSHILKFDYKWSCSSSMDKLLLRIPSEYSFPYTTR